MEFEPTHEKILAAPFFGLFLCVFVFFFVGGGVGGRGVSLK